MGIRSMGPIGFPSDISIELDDTPTFDVSDIGTALLQASSFRLPESSGHFDGNSARSPISLGKPGGHLPMDIVANDLCPDGSLSSLPPSLQSGSGSKENFELLTVSVAVAVPCLDSQLLDPLCNSGPGWLTPETPSVVNAKQDLPSRTDRTGAPAARTVCIPVDCPKFSKR